jgi:dUTP pyrophosphatase
MVRTGLAFEIPEGYELEVRPRSGLACKGSVILVNSPGTLDSDYRGELLIGLRRLPEPDYYNIEAGDRIAQVKVNEVLSIEFVEVAELSETVRGINGFGSTGR